MIIKYTSRKMIQISTPRHAAILLLVVLLSACTRTVTIEVPSRTLPPESVATASDKTGWWKIDFGLKWESEEETDWHLDALLADQVCSPALAEYRSRVYLWRFHRRAARDSAGHRFRLNIYTDPDTAEALYAQIRETAVLLWLESEGQVETLVMTEVDRPQRPPIAQTSDAGWPPEIQASWPYFIMGVSQMWLKLIEEVGAEDPQPEYSDMAAVIDYYRTVNDRVNTLWREEGQHAYLHHLNALFGYQPLVIRETNLKRF